VPASPLTVDTSDMTRAGKAFAKAADDLADSGDTRMRAAAGAVAAILVRELHSAAAASPTPQAGIVAASAQVAQGDEGATVTIGGARAVGSRGTAAGAIVMGSEHGGRNFDAPSGGAYWIAPAADRTREISGASGGPYLAACNAILRGAGLL
jgi:hypothetical protein